MIFRRMAVPVITASLIYAASMAPLAQDMRSAVSVLDATLPCISKGALTTFLKFCASNTGRITQLESPQGLPHFTAISPNYAICHSSTGNAAPNYLGSSFTPFSLTQPNGPGTLPLTIVARSADGAWQTTHSYAINTAELELVATVALRRLGAAIPFAAFAYGFDDAPGNTLNNGYDRAVDSVEQSGNGYMLFYGMLTRATSHHTAISSIPGVPTNCNVANIATPGGPADVSTSLTYNFGGFNSGASKTMKFQIRRG
jgi:hypothetical protein